jgi:3-dehydroquinate dehydratase type I
MITLSPTRPLVVASINCPDDIPYAATGFADVLEWRLDGLQGLALESCREALAACQRPVLLTARRSDEGGFYPWPDDTARLAAADTLAAHARWIDVEARTLAESAAWRAATATWRDRGIGLVVSCHDFTGVPDDATLGRAAGIAAAAGAEVLKIAASPQSLDDIHRLGLVFTLPGPALRSVMGMGKFGRASRLLFAAAGSVLNYGYLRAASVPGQWPADALRRLLDDE